MNKLETNLIKSVETSPAAHGTTDKRFQRFILAKNTPKVCALIESGQTDAVTAVLLSFISQSRAINGTSVCDLSIDLKQSLIENCLRVLANNLWLTAGELKLVIRGGMLGEYGDFVGLNALNLKKWIESFKSDPKRFKALSESQAKEEDQEDKRQKELYKSLCLFAKSIKNLSNLQSETLTNRPLVWRASQEFIHSQLKERKDAFWRSSKHLKATSNFEQAFPKTRDLFRLKRTVWTKQCLMSDLIQEIVCELSPESEAKKQRIFDLIEEFDFSSQNK